MKQAEASMTAKICAFTRAYHSKYASNKVYDDYLAYEMIGVNCGAGLDTFSFRNTNKRIQIFELDHPNTHHFKVNRIKQLGWLIPNNVHYISIDFEKQNMMEELIKVGFQPDKKTFFAILGVTYYLELESFAKIIQDMSQLTKKESIVVLDYPDRDLLDQELNRMKILKNLTHQFGEEMKGDMNRKELTKVLKANGFNLIQSQDAKEIQSNLLGGSSLKAYNNINFITAKKERQ